KRALDKMRLDLRVTLFFHFPVGKDRGCVSEPFAHGLTLREEGQVELLRRRPTDLLQVRLCQTATQIVNAILPNRSCNSMHVYEVRPRKDRRGVDLISDVLPFGHLWYDGPNAISNAVDYAQFYSRSHNAVIRVYDAAGNVIETHEQRGDFKEC